MRPEGPMRNRTMANDIKTAAESVEMARKDPVAAGGKPTKVGAFFKAPEEDPTEGKWRFLAKGSSLAAILTVFGAERVAGEKEAAFKVEAAGGMELGDLFREWTRKAAAAGVGLETLIAVVEASAAGVNVAEVLTKLAEQSTRKPDEK